MLHVFPISQKGFMLASAKWSCLSSRAFPIGSSLCELENYRQCQSHYDIVIISIHQTAIPDSSAVLSFKRTFVYRYGPLGEQQCNSIHNYSGVPTQWEGLISNANGEIHYPSIEFFGQQEAALRSQEMRQSQGVPHPGVHPNGLPHLAVPQPEAYAFDNLSPAEMHGHATVGQSALNMLEKGCMPDCCLGRGYGQLMESGEFVCKTPTAADSPQRPFSPHSDSLHVPE